MNILFLMIIPPDIRKNSNLYTELMEEFRDNGHNVYVAALDERKNKRQTRLTEHSGINILYVRTGNMFNVNPIEKGITTLFLGKVFKKALSRYFSRISFDLVIMPTPPITFAAVMNFIKKRDGAKSYLILRDIFPQNAKDIGLINNQLVFKFFRGKEKFMYKVSDYIGCMSQGNIDYVMTHNPEVDKNKLELLPNWCKVDIEKRQSKSEIQEVDYKKKYGLNGKFVCIFGGNIGWAQELEFLLKLAKSVQEREGIVFLIVGKGIAKSKIEKIVQEENLKNVIMKEFLPKDDYDGLVSQCDVGLINLDRRFTIPNIPSKTTGYFKSEIPILASIDKCTDYGKILDEAKAGLWSITGDLEHYRRNLLLMVDNPEKTKEMGKNGREYLEKNCTSVQTYHTIINHFNKYSRDV